LSIPSIIPSPTPNETEYISIDFLKTPFVRFSTVIPSELSAGSASVAPNPRQKANRRAIIIPMEYLYNGELSILSSLEKAAGTRPPD